MGLVESLKKVPVDLGQAEMREKTKGKLIGFNCIRPNPNGTALDIGCRYGEWSEKLKEKGYDVESIDIDPHYDGAKRVDVNNGLAYKDNTFDIIWCSEVIEHLEEPKESIKEMIRVTKDEGMIILTTPNSFFWLVRILYIFGMQPSQIQNKGHLHFFDLKGLRKVVPEGTRIYGYFPYYLLKKKVSALVGVLSPTFVAVINIHK